MFLLSDSNKIYGSEISAQFIIRSRIHPRRTRRDILRADNKDGAVLITGKGTDPFIMGPNGSKLPLDDATVAREELQKLAR